MTVQYFISIQGLDTSISGNPAVLSINNSQVSPGDRVISAFVAIADPAHFTAWQDMSIVFNSEPVQKVSAPVSSPSPPNSPLNGMPFLIQTGGYNAGLTTFLLVMSKGS